MTLLQLLDECKKLTPDQQIDLAIRMFGGGAEWVNKYHRVIIYTRLGKDLKTGNIIPLPENDEDWIICQDAHCNICAWKKYCRCICE